MKRVDIKAGPYMFGARLEEELAPKTSAKFLSMLPLRQKLIHVRWSGEAIWIPFGDLNTGIGYENATTYPALGDVIFHPGGVSETEILIAYGSVSFASKVGPLAGNHFLTIDIGRENLPALGKLTLWSGAQDIEITKA
jgi:hypothetical protein